jgi:mRNA-degrading endonuclease toxin of MazEF toxin-antitoxin module
VMTLPSAAAVPAGWAVVVGVAVNASVSTTVAAPGTQTIGGVDGVVTLTTTTGKVELISDGVSNYEAVRAGT